MKLKELHEGKAPPQKRWDFIDWCAVHLRNPRSTELTSNDDGTFTFENDLKVKQGLNNLSIPEKIKEVKGSFDIRDCIFDDIRNFPPKVDGSVYAGNCAFSTLDNWPITNIGGSLFLHNNPITSLVGTVDLMSKMKIGLHLGMSWNKITEGGLSLVMLDVKDLIAAGTEITEPFQIIQKYLGRPDDIFECQAELIEAGFEEHAQL